MISLRYELTTFRNFLVEFANFLGAPFTDNTVHFPENYGQGYMRLLELPGNMEAMLSNFRLQHDIVMERKKDLHEYYVFCCEEVTDLSELTIQIESDRMLVRSEDRSAIYLTGFLYDLAYSLRRDASVRSLRVMLSPTWMQQFLGLSDKDKVLEKYLEMKTAGIWLKKIDPEAKETFKELFNGEQNNLLFMQNRILRLVEKFFSGLSDELQRLPHVAGVSRHDIEQMMKIESVLIKDVGTPPPTIPELARTAAMSESKLKKLFKAVYGLPPYEYYQKNRMQKAKLMLLTGRYSIKDVGYALGYSNLSNFTLAFKKEFKQLPSELLK